MSLHKFDLITFDYFFASDQAGFYKSRPAIYALPLKALDLNPTRCYMSPVWPPTRLGPSRRVSTARGLIALATWSWIQTKTPIMNLETCVDCFLYIDVDLNKKTAPKWGGNSFQERNSGSN
jgi:hypothetical protein